MSAVGIIDSVGSERRHIGSAVFRAGKRLSVDCGRNAGVVIGKIHFEKARVARGIDKFGVVEIHTEVECAVNNAFAGKRTLAGSV